MSVKTETSNQFKYVRNFKSLIDTHYEDKVNAICWKRNLLGDFSEIVSKIELDKNIKEISIAELNALSLSDEGHQARKTILNDLKVLKNHGAEPTLNLIKNYERDLAFPFFPTDVYSFHVDRSPIPTHTFLCTYFGESSEIIGNSQALQKIKIPEIRHELQKQFKISDREFEAFSIEYFFDLHYQANSVCKPHSLGIGNLWKLAVDHPESVVEPCIHRAPTEQTGQMRLLLIC